VVKTTIMITSPVLTLSAMGSTNPGYGCPEHRATRADPTGRGRIGFRYPGAPIG
jgi:hypothetical protein